MGKAPMGVSRRPDTILELNFSKLPYIDADQSVVLVNGAGLNTGSSEEERGRAGGGGAGGGGGGTSTETIRLIRDGGGGRREVRDESPFFYS